MDENKEFYMLTLNRARIIVIVLIVILLVVSFFFLGLSIGLNSKSWKESFAKKENAENVKFDDEESIDKPIEPENYSKSIINGEGKEKQKSSQDLLIEDSGVLLKTPGEKEKLIVKDIKINETKIIPKKQSIRSSIEKKETDIHDTQKIDEKIKDVILKKDNEISVGYSIQLFATGSQKAAVSLKNKLSRKGYTVYIIKTKNNDSKSIYKVKVGPFKNKQDTFTALKDLKSKHDFKDAFITTPAKT